VDGEELVADHVLAGRKCRGDLRGVAKGVHYLAGTPLARRPVAGDEARLGDLEPVQARRVDGGARAAACGHVDHHRALRMRPLRPLGGDRRACGGSCGELVCGGGAGVVAAEGLSCRYVRSEFVH
jgi:hypothetical protein